MAQPKNGTFEPSGWIHTAVQPRTGCPFYRVPDGGGMIVQNPPGHRTEAAVSGTR